MKTLQRLYQYISTWTIQLLFHRCKWRNVVRLCQVQYCSQSVHTVIITLVDWLFEHMKFHKTQSCAWSFTCILKDHVNPVHVIVMIFVSRSKLVCDENKEIVLKSKINYYSRAGGAPEPSHMIVCSKLGDQEEWRVNFTDRSHIHPFVTRDWVVQIFEHL